jgi:hypothetical protein
VNLPPWTIPARLRVNRPFNWFGITVYKLQLLTPGGD